MTSRQLLKSKIETLADEEVEEVLEYISVMESVREQIKSPDPFDEMIVRLLSEAMKRASPAALTVSGRRARTRN